MKTIIKIKNLGLGLVAVFLMLFSVSGFAQVCVGNQITLSIKNMVATSTTLEYDIYMMNTGSTTIKVSAFAGNVRFPIGILPAGTGQLQVVDHPVATGNWPGMASMAPSFINNGTLPGQARWTNTPFLPESSSVILESNVDKKWGRFRITNPGAPWVNVPCQLTFNTAINPGGATLNTVTVYCEGNTTSTPVSLAAGNLVLQNPAPIMLGEVLVDCFTSGSFTQTAPTCFGRTDGTATITMSPTPTSSSASYVLDGGASVPVTLDGSDSFTITGLAAGPHTLTVTGDTGCAASVSVPFTVDAGTQPPMPTLACYETATFNSTTCAWEVSGTQPPMPTLACYETATFNTTSCAWEVSGTQPPMPTGLACYETATFNTTSCAWEVSGTQPPMPTLACYETATFNTTSCAWEVSGTQPPMPTLACYETATFNGTTCAWEVSGTQPPMPTLACYETATFNTTSCAWEVSGTQPPMPTLACYETASFNTTTCAWEVSGTQPPMPTGLACYETATFNTTTCAWEVSGTQPPMPTLACYETASFNSTTCAWEVSGTQPPMPTGLACYETATFNGTTCAWEVSGTQPPMPTLACYETASFNSTTCAWEVSGTQPPMPTLACYETASFNSTTCAWEVSGTQPPMPALACYETASFNSTTCAWEVSGTQPPMPTIACYENATFNGTTCAWEVSGTQPPMPTLACYETASFNTTTCAWEVSGTQPPMPTLACYETASFNTTTCAWEVSGTQPPMPSLGACETASFNTTTCAWDVTSTATTLGNVTTTVIGSYTWSGPYGTGLTYTSSGVYTSVIGCNTATLNLTVIPGGSTVNTFNIGTSCGATISNLSVTIHATPVSGATTYTFRLTNMTTSAVMIINRPVSNFALGNYVGVTLGTQYQIEVSVNGGANYGAPCIVNTPAPVSTIGAQCGSDLTSMGQFVYATTSSSVTGYRFRITNPNTSAFVTYDAPSGLNRFSFNQLPPAFVSFATTYVVEVALRNTDGTYLPYGPACNIATPVFPTSEVVLSQCDYTATSNTQSIGAVIVSGATHYRFNLVNSSLSYDQSIDRSVNTFSLSMFPGLLPGTTYTVRVAVRINGVWGPLTGKPCNLTTPGSAPVITRVDVAANDFAAVAYPNPFAENFMLDVKTTAQSSIQVRVYDMLGKQVENRNVEVSDIANFQIGGAYPSGVYNVIVSQGEKTQTLRVIKR